MDLDEYLEDDSEPSGSSLDDIGNELESYDAQDSISKYGFSVKEGLGDLKNFYFWNSGTVNGAIIAGFGAYEFAVSGGSEGEVLMIAGLTFMALDQAAKTTY